MLLALTLATLILAWAFVGLAGLAYPQTNTLTEIAKTLYPRLMKHFDDPGEQVAWGIKGVAGLLVIGGFISYFAAKEGPFHDFSAEMVGIGFGVLGIDELNRRRSEQELKKQTFRQIRYSSTAFAVEALEVARHQGWIDEIIHPQTNLKNVHLEGADLSSAHLEGARLANAYLEGATLQGAHLEGAILWDAHLEGAILWDAHLEGATLWGAHLVGTKLGGAYLNGADLADANLKDAKLANLHLAGANLKGADLEGTNAWEAHLEGAIYDDHTQWPTNFDPESHGAINWDTLTEEQREAWRAKYRPKAQNEGLTP